MKLAEQVRDTLWQEVEGLTDEQLNKTVAPDTWSIAQIMEHVSLMERAITHSASKVVKSDQQTTVSPKPIERSTDRTVKVNAPDYVTPSDQPKSRAELEEMLNRSRETFRSYFNSLDEQVKRQKAFPHPMFGDLDLAQWEDFIAYHEKRHIEQLKEVKEAL